MNMAIEDVTETLTSNGVMSSTNIPNAAPKLNDYSKAFKELELLADNTRQTPDNTIMELQ